MENAFLRFLLSKQRLLIFYTYEKPILDYILFLVRMPRKTMVYWIQLYGAKEKTKNKWFRERSYSLSLG